MEIRDSIAARARRQGKSMQEYLLGELEELTAKPTVEAWLERVRVRAQKAGSKVTAEQIVDSIKSDRC